jgi:hypothetical protein
MKLSKKSAFFLFIFLIFSIGAGPIKSEAELNNILQNFTTILNPYVQSQKNTPFLATGDWKKEYVETSAGGSFYYPQVDGIRYLGVHVAGWLVRFESFKRDEIETVLCHELGHHFVGGGDEHGADYFVTSTCLPLLWAGQNHSEKFNTSDALKLLSPSVRSQCKKHNSEAYCLRTTIAMSNIGRFRQWVWTKRDVDIDGKAENDCRMSIALQGLFQIPFKSCY